MTFLERDDDPREFISPDQVRAAEAANLAEAANAASPANDVPVFTPPEVPQVGNLSELAQELNAREPVQPEIDVASVAEASFGPRADPNLAVGGPPPVVAPQVGGGGVAEFFTEDIPRNIPGAFPRTIEEALDTEAFDEATGRLAAAGDDPRAQGSAVADVLLRGIGRAGRTIGGVVSDVFNPADIDVSERLGEAAQFAGGFFGGGPEEVFADDGTGVTGQVDAESGEQGELNAADSSEKDAQEAATQEVSAGGLENAVPPSLVSDQPGAESGIGGSTLADRILGPPLRPADERGPGVEVIRGLRRSFQPLDERGVAVGGEIPAGAGILERAQNAGMTLEAAADFAIDVADQEARLISAGAQALVAQTNAMIKTNLTNGNLGFIVVDQNGNRSVWDSQTAIPLSDTIQIIKRPVTIVGSTGETLVAQSELLMTVTMDEDGEPIARQINEGESPQDVALRNDNFQVYQQFLEQAKNDGLSDTAAHDRAMQELKAAFALAGQ
jgi:hypothetical protein